jgi:hypothetical protein
MRGVERHATRIAAAHVARRLNLLLAAVVAVSAKRLQGSTKERRIAAVRRDVIGNCG